MQKRRALHVSTSGVERSPRGFARRGRTLCRAFAAWAQNAGCWGGCSPFCRQGVAVEPEDPAAAFVGARTNRVRTSGWSSSTTVAMLGSRSLIRIQVVPEQPQRSPQRLNEAGAQ